ncbi:MAG: glycosyl transferase family 1 [Bacteroidales bacterium]|jgi:glycosyltransferase involved in cell wall biosynthesis|nr:glycosyl transferase family 1 [Bacteroidales bacterium]
MKKVLVISYYWPPSGGIGVHRCLKFVKYLQDFGWEPVVYAPLNAQYEYCDDTNFKDIPENITIIRRKILEPFGLFKKISGRKKTDSANPIYLRDRKPKPIDKMAIWIRGNLFIPDARKFWIRPSVKFLKKYLKENPVDVIFSDGPPHTNTMIACKLSKKTGIPWLMDFQDPWTQVDYYSMLKIGKRADRIHHKLEREAFNTAKKTTIVSPTWKKDLESIGATNVDVIVWGYDEDDFGKEDMILDEDFSIIHAGQLGFDRKPDTFIKVLGDIKKENPEFAKNLKIKFAGKVDYSIIELINDNGLADNYTGFGNIPRPQALEITLKAHILFLPLNKADNAKGRIPGKLFENIRAKRPILCLGPTDSDVSNILKETNTGKTFEYDDYENIKKYILDIYSKYLSKNNIIDARNLEKYTVKNQTKLLAGYLDKIT